MNKQKYERRLLNHEVRMSQEEDGAQFIEGYAAKFNTRSEDFGGWVETIEKGAFDDVLGDDVRALIDHEPRLILGRSKAGTLELWVDEVGLAYRAKLPDTTYAKDLSVSVSRGDVDQSSFGFRVKDATWETRDGQETRVIQKVERLYDVSPVTYPAYPDTSVAKRSLQLKEEEEELDRQRRDSIVIRFKMIEKLNNEE